MDVQQLALTALRATVIYVFLLVLIRFLGKRTVGHSSAFDFMVALVLGELVDEPIYGDVGLPQAFVALGVIGGWHAINQLLSYRSERFDRLTGGAPAVLVRDGAVDRDAMARERINDEDLRSLLRLHGLEDVGDVALATLEPSGRLSVLTRPEARPLQRGDLERAVRRVA
jgi:uncharacterized membrane protein YcaP (DUF421 family)